jgi:hypothetical protein
MSDTKKTSHTIGKIKQLIDLNGDNTNFDLSFTVTCQDDTPFHLLVVDQTTLDNTPELQYKEVNGTISGNIVADKNIYQNYFLILKSENTCTVDIERTLKVLPKTPDSELGLGDGQGDGLIPPINQSPKVPRKIIGDEPSSINWKKIGLIALVVIIGAGVLWWLYKKNGKEPEVSHSFNNIMPEYNPVQSLIPPRSQSPINMSPVNKYVSPVLSTASDARVFKPVYKRETKVKPSISPDVMSQTSRRSFGGDNGGNSLLNRLRKFAH